MRFGLLAVFAAGLVTGAQAADWSGGYAGLNVGGADGASGVDNPFKGVGFGQSSNAKGPVLGAQAGWNFQDGDLVYGAEATADLASLTGTATCLSGSHIGRCKPEVSGLATFDGRLGWADGANLYYAKAGLAWMAERQNYLLFDPVPEAASADANRWGWTVGAGLEHRVAARWSLRLDYRYLGFDGASFALATPRALDFDAHAHVFTAGVNWYPDAGAAPGAAPVFAASVFDAPDDEPGAWAFEVAARVFGAGGDMKKDFDGYPGNENSRLTYQGLPLLAGEIFARADHQSGWFA